MRFFPNFYLLGNRDNVDCEHDDLLTILRILTTQQISSSLLQIIQTIVGNHPASCTMVTVDFLQKWKRQGSDTDPSPLSSVESTNWV